MTTEIEYTVEVYTGGKMGAGTDSNVFATLHGANGDSGLLLLLLIMLNLSVTG